MPILLNPLFLMALAAAAAPIAMHLLHRRNPKPIEFSTLRFLQAAIAKTRRSRQVTQLLTLLLRLLVIALLAFAFAQPRLPAAGWLPDGPRTLVLVLDASASMRARDVEQVNFERARAWSLALLGTLREQDKVALIMPGLAEPRVIFPAIANKGLVERALRDAVCGYGKVNLVPTIHDAQRWIREAHPRETVELHVFSDFQSTAWAGQEVKDLGTVLNAMDARVFLNRTAAPTAPNAWIAALRLAPEAILGEGEIQARVAVQANAYVAGANTVRLDVDGREADRRGLTMTPSARQELTLTTQVTAATTAVAGAVRLDADPLPEDNVRYFVLERRDRVNVLLLDGSSASVENQRDTWYLERALNPGRLPNPLVQAEVRPWATLTGTDLGRYEAVFVANPPSLTDADALKLEQYASLGGVVVLYPGPAGGLERDLARLKPFADVTVSRETLPTTTRWALSRADDPHPLELQTLGILGSQPAFMGNARLQLTGKGARYYQFEDSRPMMISRPVGHGAIWLAALSANRLWSEWPLSPDYVLFHQLLIRNNIGNVARTLTGEVGVPVEMGYSAPVTTLQADLTSPAGDTRPLTLTRADESRGFLLPAFATPGLYRLDLRGDTPATRYVAVNVPLAESDLSPIEEAELARQLAPLQVYQPRDFHAMQGILAGLTHGFPLWPWLLLAAFLVAIAEELFANWRSWAQSVPDTLQNLLRVRRA